MIKASEAGNHFNELSVNRSLILDKYQQKLETILAQSPVESMSEGLQMAMLLEDIYPGNTVTRWWYTQLDQLAAQGNAPGYEQAGQMLQVLMDELLSNEKQHRTVTISFLKSAIYDIQLRMKEIEPLSYQLTSIEHSIRNGKQPSPAELQKVNDQLKGIQSRYLHVLQALKSANTPHSYQDEKK